MTSQRAYPGGGAGKARGSLCTGSPALEKCAAILYPARLAGCALAGDSGDPASSSRSPCHHSLTSKPDFARVVDIAATVIEHRPMPNVDDLTALLIEANDCLDRMRHWHAGIGPREEDSFSAAKRLARVLEGAEELARRAYPDAGKSG